MAFEKAEKYLSDRGFGDRIQTFQVSSATVELAARALGTEPARIAKSLTFSAGEGAIMVVCAGDVKVNSGKFKQTFGVKAKMLTFDQVHCLIGHDVGGVCPFGVNPGVAVYLDESMKRFEYVYPACGSDCSAVKLTPRELEQLSGSAGWVDVCVPMADTVEK
ncbi:MAG: YbaK/EbsC family protein [Faecousia sp.]